MTNYLQYFFNLSHLFSLRPQAMQLRAVLMLAVIFGLALAVGLVAMVLKKKQRGLTVAGFNQLSSAGLTMGISGLLYLFFAWQGVALLGSRFWILVWVIITVIWSALIIRYFTVTIPKRIKENLKKQRFEKYIP
ncbi:MAG: hypothetical protein UY81_C0082G0003 [Candidatus Giovannonibacteria bacterium GW2011_GWA2_53_7]|uniref:Uncharacterized protein n=1 Tax=Candidatus Giovannonibacteria bacterium GW2011_GWA2_53_7 TaxID=1618650 RepID=A0A0G1XSQ9_9BACT|nr:MAG: hypothetical protein UY81_C0082G0003 [Candidatus Giovannonibacteria bacterium GW2011_GWA2_53_7]